ncbi:hypothetical protein PVK06_012630 [Gossypium arboreum]|uniref:Aminotransferase-like plant mobile domain-containing protein n=1 Tax=Gossypium arboreum TaxID=29729 RepID=A0ABR0QDA2_GOSAR|nr:hypothetical protein PVK06_012630 [Gossypium arboreum]
MVPFHQLTLVEGLQQAAPLVEVIGRSQEKNFLTNGQGPYCVLKGHVNDVGYLLELRFMPYLEASRFGSGAMIHTFDLKYNLITALVEWWCPETYTFHLLCGECTITLEDVVLQLGLSIDGSVVTDGGDLRRSSIYNAYDMGCTHARCNNNKVHLMYFPLLSYLYAAHSYSWGSAVLVTLYRELFRTTKRCVVDIGRCLVLLRSWELYKMSFLATVTHQTYVFPLVNR